MAHAAVILVKLDPNSDFEHRQAIMNEFIIPEVKALPGFQKATWMNDGTGRVQGVTCSIPRYMQHRR
jgi:hypothetical protein